MNKTIKLCKSFSATCIGLEVVPVTVEVSISIGVGIYLVGLPDSAVRESLHRVIAALTGNGFSVPGKKTVINMAPADLKKEGSSFDAAIATALLAASGQISDSSISRFIIVGELSLGGEMRKVHGVLPIAAKAAEMGFKGCILPKECAGEAADVTGIDIYGAADLKEVVDILNGEEYCSVLKVTSPVSKEPSETGYHDDFAYIAGQEFAKRGMEIAASGGHNIMLIGPPGAGKSFMARCLASVLPKMSRCESLETSMIYSVAGRLDGNGGLMTARPFRSPHHTASFASLVGGGKDASPGEISLAHNGVLYLDEVNLFPASVLDMLRQPLEDRSITISRVRYKVSYPASFMLVGSMNPCPCGWSGFEGGHKCTCPPGIIQRYRNRISGPLMDRIDLSVSVKPVESERLVNGAKGESSTEMARRVAEARRIQIERFRDEGIYTNAQMNAAQLTKYCPLGEEEKVLCNKIMKHYSLSARGYSRILKVARTIADMEHIQDIRTPHLLEAVQYRLPEH